MTTHEEAVRLFEKRRDAWLHGDLDVYLGLFHDDLVFQSPAHVEPMHGKAAFAALVRQSFKFSKPVRFEFHHIAVDGGVVLAEWTIAIERRDSGRRLEWRGMSVCEIADGRITRWREFWNLGSDPR